MTPALGNEVGGLSYRSAIRFGSRPLTTANAGDERALPPPVRTVSKKTANSKAAFRNARSMFQRARHTILPAESLSVAASAWEVIWADS